MTLSASLQAIDIDDSIQLEQDGNIFISLVKPTREP